MKGKENAFFVLPLTSRNECISWIPLLASTSCLGFEKYVAKFDRDTLLSTLSQTLLDNPGEAA